jgi:outer membrane protein assembly factor BamA
MAIAFCLPGGYSLKNRLIKIITLLWLICIAAATHSPAARAATAFNSSTASSAITASDEPTHRSLELEDIVVVGNSHIADSAIIGTLGLGSHDTVNVAILEEARLRLLKEYPLLSAIDFSTRPGSRRGFVILDISVVERNRLIFETGYGLHDTYGWFLTLLGLRVEPAVAYGTEYRLGLRLGFHIAGLDGEFERRAKPGGFGLGGNFHIYSQKQIFFGGETAPTSWDAAGAGQYTREFRQKIERSGVELHALYMSRDSTRFSFGFHAEGVRPESSFVESDDGQKYEFDEFPALLRAGIRKTAITGLVLRVVRDTRDRPDYPRSGSFAMLQAQSNSTFFGGDETFGKAEGDFRKHIGLGNWYVLSGRLAGGIVSKGTPYYDKFFLGGVYSVRGFRELSLSPPSGSDGFIIASNEFRFPLITSTANMPPRLTGLLFIDAGIGWERGKILKWSDIEAAAGYGVRLRLPWIGTLGFDVGIPFTESRTGDKFYINGCVGFSF